MSVHQKKMTDIQDKFKGQIDSTIGKEIKKAEEERSKYDKACKNVQELSDQIKNFMEKFDTLKVQIEDSSQKFQDYKIDVDTRKTEIMTLETQNQNMINVLEQRQQLTNKMKDEKTRLQKQHQTLNNLKNAL